MKQASPIRTSVLTLLTMAFGLTLLALVVSLVFPSRLGAQDVSALSTVAVQTTVAPSAVASPLAGPRDVQAGIARRTAEPMLQPMHQGATSRNVAWMIVGGATLVVGSVIGGDAGTIMMVTGGVIGLVGLMRYLQ